MYNQPATEVMDLKTVSLMISVSPGAPTDPSTPPPVNAPKKPGDDL